MAALHPWNIIRLNHLDSSVAQSLQEARILTAPQGRVRLLRGTEIVLDSKMELHAATFKPATSTPGKLRWLGQFRHSQQACIKGASRLLLAVRHSELNVINGGEDRFGHIDMLDEKR
jgi:hypothetical protein